MTFIMYSSARPPFMVEKTKTESGHLYIITPNSSLQYPSAEYLREKVMKENKEEKTTIVIDGKYIKNIDSTVAKVCLKNYFLFATRYYRLCQLKNIVLIFTILGVFFTSILIKNICTIYSFNF